ncbi:GTP cyclohydrolase I [Microbacterium sp. JB110]|uniref:GTP cyclohydrolase I n=1 Tax=Microbacterium sp. JB110 TaxID=2024477 RepID=UPI000B35194B|nr:GTP cyclohydrolase I [Microbacterium sp. JB110]RCS60333.1 GTP cyclohydrolase I [Microbacterium sp. JB110]
MAGPEGVDRDRVAELTRELLIAIGEDPDRPGLTRTPERVAEMVAEMFGGLSQDPAAPLASTISVASGPAPETQPSGAVIVRGVRFRSVCEHHLLPSHGTAHVAYLPGEKVVGLGAFTKVIDILANRPQVQERLGEQIADTIAQALAARGVVVVLDAVHQCVTMRGAQQTDSSTVTIATRGELADPAARAEIIALIGKGEG